MYVLLARGLSNRDGSVSFSKGYRDFLVSAYILLKFGVELGLLVLAAFAFIVRKLRSTRSWIVIAPLLVMTIHGLFDVPFFKPICKLLTAAFLALSVILYVKLRKNALYELWLFGLKEAQACIFAGSFFALLFASKHIPLFGLARYDFIFCRARDSNHLHRYQNRNADEAKAILPDHVIGLVLKSSKPIPRSGAGAIRSWIFQNHERTAHSDSCTRRSAVT